VSTDNRGAIDYFSSMAGELQIALQVVRDQRKVIDEQDAQIAALKAKLGALEGAIVEKFGAHGVLICQYSDPNRPDAERRKAAQAAIAYEKPRVGGLQEHAVYHLFDHLETARLAKRQAKVLPQIVDVTPSSDPAA
jgi:hypothetical protein